MRLWPKRKPRTYYIGDGHLRPGGTTIRVVADHPPPGAYREPRKPGQPDWGMRIGATVLTIVVIGFFSLVGYIVVVYAIGGKPTARERERATISRQQVEITQLRQRVDSLSLRLDALEGR